jgi:mersacidin/lichenicidin family type 2 lantibiotic
MSKLDIVRAWKDEAYRLSLSEAQRASLPANPAGEIVLSEADLEQVAAGKRNGGGGGGGTGPGTGTSKGTGGRCTKCSCC